MPQSSDTSTDEILDRLPAGFIAFTDDGIVTLVNRTLGTMLEMSPEHILGQRVEIILTVPSRIFYQTHVFPLLKVQGRVEEVYLSVRMANGDELPTLINGVRFEGSSSAINELLMVPMKRRNDYEDQILAAKRDLEQANNAKDIINESLQITQDALKRQQEQLRLRNCELESLKESLEEQVAARTAELTKMVAELEGFNYSIAHDLRAPLRGIQMSGALLLRECPDNLSEEQLELLRTQVANSKRMTKLIEDLLQFSRLNLVPMKRHRVDISRFARSAAERVLRDYERSDISIHVEPDLEATGDRTMIDLVVHQLIDNAVKYSPNGGVVRLGWSGSAFFVSDTGIGISERYKDKIFRPFERLHRDDEFSGTGIGLANVQRIISRHGGRIWFESEEGKGTTFFFTLPEG